MSSYSVKKPITVLMVTLIVVVLGVFSLTKLSLGLFPEMNLPYAVVVTPYVGADAETVVNDVTSPIESKVTSLNNFKQVSSTSSEHYSVVIVEFEEGTDMNNIVIELRETLDNIDFPEGVENPTLMRISPDMLPVMSVSMSVEYPELNDEQEFIKATEFINNDILERLNRIDGVAEVSLTGSADVVLQVKLNQQLLSEIGYTNNDILALIKEQNLNSLVGIALDEGEIRLLYLGNTISNIDELKALPLPLKVNGTNKVYKLNELAEEDGINLINNNTESYSKVNGKQTISVSFQKQNDAEITDVTRAITKELNAVIDEYANVSYRIVMDQGDYIELAVGSVLQNLILGAILAIVILFIFLRDIRPTFIVALAIPTSLIATFMCMYFVGINLNMLSMGGLAISVGMLVDNAIVVIENIYRLRSLGVPKKEAAIQGAKGVMAAITSSTLTTIVVFLPFVFLGGTISDMFMNMAYTITFSLIASLIIALTLVPSVGAQILSDKNIKDEGKVVKKINKLYERIINFFMKKKAITISIVIVMLAGVVLLSVQKGFILLPSTDEGSLSVDVVVDSEVGFEDMSNYVDHLTSDIQAISDEIETVSASFGSSTGLMSQISSMSQATNAVSISILLKDNHKTATADFEPMIKKVIEDFDYSRTNNVSRDSLKEVDVAASTSSSITSLMSSGISIKVKGHNLEEIEAVANKIAEIVATTEGTMKTSNGVIKATDNVKIYVDKQKAAEKGVTQTDVFNSLDLLFSDSSLNVFNSESEITLSFNGMEYALQIPSDMNIAGSSLSSMMALFGDYEDFLSNVYIFDKDMLAKIDEFGTAVYSFMPILKPGYTMNDFMSGNLEAVESMTLTILPNYYYDLDTEKVITFDPNNMEMMLKYQAGTIVPLTSKAVAKVYDLENTIVDVKKVTGFGTIYTDGKYRYLSVTAAIQNGYNVTLVGDDVDTKVEEYLNSPEFLAYGDSVQVEFVGENEEIMNTMKDMLIVALLAIALVYMIMAIQFQSLKYPLIILGTIPLAFTGGLGFALLFNVEISIVVIMGLIVLVGVVVNNGIVLIDYINQLRAEGKSIKEACIEAGKTRLRPILMTAFTTIGGLFTMAIGLSDGSELLQPMAITAIGGLTYSTLLTLLVVPVIYAAVEHRKYKEEEKAASEEAPNNVNEE